MDLCNICGSSNFRRTADDVFICTNGHINKDMQILETEYEVFNTQVLSQSQPARKLEESKMLFGHEEYLMYIDAVQYCLVKYSEQLQEIISIDIMRSVFELWISWLTKNGISENAQQSTFESALKASDAFSVLWLACQLNFLPISFNDLIELLQPIDIPNRYKDYITKNQLKHLNIKISNNIQNLFAMLNYFDFVQFPVPNIQIYACYLITDLKLPLEIAEHWYSAYNTDYWHVSSNYYRMTFDLHVIWSLYAYIVHLFEDVTFEFDFQSWICQWYHHITHCCIPPKNSKLALFLQQTNFLDSLPSSIKKQAISVPNDFSVADKDNVNIKFTCYCDEAVNCIPKSHTSPKDCSCFQEAYTGIDYSQFSYLSDSLFLYFSPRYDSTVEAIKLAEQRYFDAYFSK
eukprot:NODE_35_length_31537_cov_0.293403.p6 type:complete len:403 gc:universal NODE_35_length_31537_cov_0.293403:6588-5380(-)